MFISLTLAWVSWYHERLKKSLTKREIFSSKDGGANITSTGKRSRDLKTIWKQWLLEYLAQIVLKINLLYILIKQSAQLSHVSYKIVWIGCFIFHLFWLFTLPTINGILPVNISSVSELFPVKYIWMRNKQLSWPCEEYLDKSSSWRAAHLHCEQMVRGEQTRLLQELRGD